MFIIRKALPEDALSIMIVNVYTWKTTYTGLMPDEAIDARISHLRENASRCRADLEKNGNCLVAAVGNTVVGFCMYGKSRNERFRDAGELFALYVLKGFQGTGAGKELFLAGAKELCAKQYSSMIVNCLHKNPSLGFYLHMGGETVGQRCDDVVGGKATEDIVLFRDLSHMLVEKS